MLRFMTAGESHGKALLAIVEGVVAGLELQAETIDRDLARRQLGHGRGKRMSIEKDQVEILSGVRFGRTMGNPIGLMIRNRDWPNWEKTMDAREEASDIAALTRPRPGHADLAGLMKYGHKDIRNVLERSSARETAARVAVGAICKSLTALLGVQIVSHVTRIGRAVAEGGQIPSADDMSTIDASPVRCFDKSVEAAMVDEIDAAVSDKDTVGGVFEVIAYGCPPGLGSFATWDGKLDGRISRAITSIPAVKGVELGSAFEQAQSRGSVAQDEIFYAPAGGFRRGTNRAGGLEAGVTNGEPLLVRAAMKPIPTLGKPLRTVDVESKAEATAFKERADVCAVPAAAVIAEAVVAIELAAAAVEKFGGDSAADMVRSWESYRERLRTM
ncbi:MAG: chorismate synthase [Terriglobia bacterium]